MVILSDSFRIWPPSTTLWRDFQKDAEKFAFPHNRLTRVGLDLRPGVPDSNILQPYNNVKQQNEDRGIPRDPASTKL